MESIMPDADPFAGTEVISAYSRAQALEDGELVDLSELAREAGFKYPLAVTRGVWALLAEGSLWAERPNGTAELEADPAWAGTGQSWKGRARDMLCVMRAAIRNATDRGRAGDEIRFAPLFLRKPGGRPERVPMWSKCAPGDTAEPVITVMLEGED